MSASTLTTEELQILETAIKGGAKIINIRLRKGEYQFDLAKAIASFELELCFPNAKDLIKKLYGEGKTEDPRFVQKIQTILKKMEKSNVVRILPKDKPWELQRYALSSFKFQDAEKNLIVLATDEQIKKTQTLLRPKPTPQPKPTIKANYVKTKILALILLLIISYTVVMWTLAQLTINLTILMPAFCIAIVFSFILGKLLAQKQ